MIEPLFDTNSLSIGYTHGLTCRIHRAVRKGCKISFLRMNWGSQNFMDYSDYLSPLSIFFPSHLFSSVIQQTCDETPKSSLHLQHGKRQK